MANKKRPRKQIDPAELATILAFGDRHGDKKAAAEFKVSLRTLQRYRAAVRDGKMPELAELVAQQKRAAVERCSDLLAETYEKTLRRLQEVLPQAQPREVIGATKIVGELMITRDVLRSDHEQQLGPDRQSPEAQGDPGEATCH